MSYKYGTMVRAFSEVNHHDYIRKLKEQVEKEVQSLTKTYILGVDEEEYKNYLIEKYTVVHLVIDFSEEHIGEPMLKKEWAESFPRGERYQRDVYIFTVTYPFTGSSHLFKVMPSQWTMLSEEIYIDDAKNTVSISFPVYNQDTEEFKRSKSEFHYRAFTNYGKINPIVDGWNQGLKNLVNYTFQAQKAKYLRENNFFAAVNVKVNNSTTSVFTAPTITKKVIPQPTVSKTKEFSSEPMMSREMYNDVLKVIFDAGKSMETKPALYQGKDEEGLRDQFIFLLETRYEGTTATGETFNRGGKTDIILKYAPDGSNLFVAECKFWHGSAEFLKAISQLFDRYLTWRDSKVALILFVKNKDFSNVIQTVLSDINNHDYYVRENGKRGDSSLSYIFKLPQDENKAVYLEIILFHYDK